MQIVVRRDLYDVSRTASAPVARDPPRVLTNPPSSRRRRNNGASDPSWHKQPTQPPRYAPSRPLLRVIRMTDASAGAPRDTRATGHDRVSGRSSAHAQGASRALVCYRRVTPVGTGCSSGCGAPSRTHCPAQLTFVFQTPDVTTLEKLSAALSSADPAPIPHHIWTEQPENVPTCIALAPNRKEKAIRKALDKSSCRLWRSD